jgi:dolichyl-phosphate-mannose--protein O-mannosyl transferase
VVLVQRIHLELAVQFVHVAEELTNGTVVRLVHVVQQQKAHVNRSSDERVHVELVELVDILQIHRISGRQVLVHQIESCVRDELGQVSIVHRLVTAASIVLQFEQRIVMTTDDHEIVIVTGAGHGCTFSVKVTTVTEQL